MNLTARTLAVTSHIYTKWIQLFQTRDPRTAWSELVRDFLNFFGAGPVRGFKFFVRPGSVRGLDFWLVLVRAGPNFLRKIGPGPKWSGLRT